MTSLGEWLDARTPPPPAALRERLRDALGDDLHGPASEAHDRCLAASERLVGAIVAGGASTRAVALDLLAADALVTYAFEAAADEPERLAERTDEAMRRLSAPGATASARA
jgi:hypothetical protein